MEKMNKIESGNFIGSDFDSDLDEGLRDPEMAAAFINAAIEENDPSYLKVALGRIVKVLGPTDVSKLANVSRVSLYRMLTADSKPGFDSIIDILSACGLMLEVHPIGRINHIPEGKSIEEIIESTAQATATKILRAQFQLKQARRARTQSRKSSSLKKGKHSAKHSKVGPKKSATRSRVSI